MPAPIIIAAGIAARYGAKKLMKHLTKQALKKSKGKAAINKAPKIKKNGRFVSKQSQLTRKGKKIDRKARDSFSKGYGEGYDFPEADFQKYLKETPGLTKNKPKISHTRGYLKKLLKERKNAF